MFQQKQPTIKNQVLIWSRDLTTARVGAAAYNGTCIRCRFTDNTCYLGNSIVYGTSGGAGRIRLYACVLDHNYNGATKNTSSGILIYLALCVNCTVVDNIFGSCCYSANEAFYNTILCKSGSYNASCTYVNCIKDTDENFPIMSTMLTDTRIKAGSAAIGAGDGAHLAQITVAQEVADMVGLKDFGGNDIATTGVINAGANHTVCTPAAGGIAVWGGATRVNDSSTKFRDSAYSYVFPDVYPTQYLFSAEVTDPATRLCYFYFYKLEGYSPEGYDYRFPDTNDCVWIMPPANTAYVLSNNFTKIAPKVYVKPDADASVATGSEEFPYRTVQAAIDATTEPVTIIAKPGVYAEGYVEHPNYGCTRILTDRVLRITSEAGAENTILMGSPSTDPSADEYGRGPGAVRCIVQNGNMTQIQGFTLTGGRTAKTNTAGAHDGFGGAIFNASTYLSVDDCIITNNYAYQTAVIHGGRLNRCYVADNYADSFAFNGTILCGCLVAKNHLLYPENGVLVSSYRTVHSTFIGETVANAHPYSTSTTGRRFASVFLRGDTARAVGIAAGNVYGEMLTVADTTGGIAADPLLAVPDNGDCEPLAHSPVFTCGVVPAAGNYGDDYWFFARSYYNGDRIKFNDGKPVAGAFATVTTKPIVALDAANGGVTPSFSRLTIEPQDSITFTSADGSRPCAGLVVNGVTNRFEDHSGEIVISGSAAAAGGVAIVALYTTDWYVDAVNGNDANTGFYPSAAKRTLAGVLDYTKVLRGDTVHAAPGIYNQGTMKHDTEDEIVARAVLTNDLTLVATGSREETIIEGKAADIPDASQYTEKWGIRGCGQGAVKCVRMLAGSKIKGFTIRNGFTRIIQASTGKPNHGHSDTTGGGLSASYPHRNQCWAEDCLVTNCAAYRGGGMMAVKSKNCLFVDNLSDYGGGAASDCYIYNCITKDNLANNPHAAANCGVHYCYEIEGCSVFDGWADAPGCKMRNTLFLGYTNRGSPTTATNCIFIAGMANGISNEWLNTCKDCVATNLAAMTFDADGRPALGRNIAIDAADSSVVVQPCDTDFYNQQRIWNNALDIGAMDADWRPVYAQDISKSRNFAVAVADPTVEESVDKSVKVPAGAAVEALWTADGTKKINYTVTAKVTGTGTLTVTLNGEVLDAQVGTGTKDFVFANDLTANVLKFSYDGDDGYAEILDADCRGGFIMLLK
jgi:hypothetical protein